MRVATAPREATSLGTDVGKAIAVFGSSEPVDGSPLYEQARRVGSLLAREGLAVVTGGYGGVMEAASRGAVESGGRAMGITTRDFGHLRAGPNQYLTDHLETEDLYDRTRELISRCAGYIILEGKAGTLAELTFLWALHRARLLGDKPIVLLGAFWKAFLEDVETSGLLERSQSAATRITRSPEEAVGAVTEHLQ